MSVTEIRNAPYAVLFEQAERIWGELATDNEKVITGPLAAEGYDIPAFLTRMRTAIGRATDLHSRQTLRVVASGSYGPVMTAAFDDARAYLASVAKRAKVLSTKGVPLGRDLLNVLDHEGMPGQDDGYRATAVQLLNVVKQFADVQGELPGLSIAFRARAAPMLQAINAALHVDESRETRVESSTIDAVAARDALVAACIEYVEMMDVVNTDLASAGRPALPGGNLQTVRQWAATRPGVIADRIAAAAAAPASA